MAGRNDDEMREYIESCAGSGIRVGALRGSLTVGAPVYDDDLEVTTNEDLKEHYCGDPSASDEELEEAMECDDRA